MRLRILFTAACLLGLVSEGCSRGDYLGPVERTMRSLTRDWDMWFTPSVRPHEAPLLPALAGTVPLAGKVTYEKALAEMEAIPAGQRPARAALSYRRYCYHCHGPHGDGRIIVGESFDVPLPDLRRPATQQKTDAALFQQVMHGSANMIPLADTVPPAEALLALAHVRSLAGAPSEPFYPPRHAEPIR